MLVNGQWKSKWDPVQSQDNEGRFIWQGSQFRNWITPGGSPVPSRERSFARSQKAYEEAYGKVFAMLEELEERLGDGRPFLFGDRLTESDIRLFVILVHFDLAYFGLLKCNRNLIAQMPRLCNYIARSFARLH